MYHKAPCESLAPDGPEGGWVVIPEQVGLHSLRIRAASTTAAAGGNISDRTLSIGERREMEGGDENVQVVNTT